MTSSIRRLIRYVSMAVLALVLLVALGLGATQTGWFKNWLRQKAVAQAAQYLNGTLTITRLGGSVLTGVVLEGVTLRHEGHTTIAMDKLTVDYSPLTMISKGVILDRLTLENPTIRLQRDNAGWNFNRFVKTRQNTGGRGAPPIAMEAIVINNAHVIVKDQGRLLEDVTSMNMRLRFAYLKPGVQFSIHELTGKTAGINVRKGSGDLAFDRGSVRVRDFALETDRSSLVATVAYAGPEQRTLEVDLHAPRLSLPEVGHYFRPLAGIALDPAVDVKGRGTIDALHMDVKVISAAGNASGPLVGHFGGTRRGLDGTLDIQNVNMEPILNKREWATRVTGRATFDWAFAPMKVNFKFAGPEVEGLGYRAANARAQGVYAPPLLNFDASGSAYGATATTRAVFRFATPAGPLSYTLAGTFRDLDMRRLPAKLSMPVLETQTAGTYQFDAAGPDWHASGQLSDSIVEGATFAGGTLVAMASQSRQLTYSASGNIAGLNPRRFAAPLEIAWLDDERFRGSLNGSFTFEGSGRTIDDLTLHTKASLTDSTLAAAYFTSAAVDFRMANRTMHATFAGPFEHLPGSLLTAAPEFADTILNGNADMAVALAIPKTGPVELLEASGSTTLTPSTIAGLAVDSAQATGRYADQIADIKELVLTGPDIKASAMGTLAIGEAGVSDLQYDVAVTSLEPLAKRFGKPLAGSAHIVGRATGPAARLTMAGTLGANRLQYGTNIDALTATSTYTAELPNFDFEKAHIQADAAATFVTIAGRHLPRVTARTTYDSNQLQFNAMFDEQTRSLGVGGNVLFHPDHEEMHLKALDLKIGDAQWALPAGREAVVRYSADSVTISGFVVQRGAQQLTAEGTVAVGSGSSDLANKLNVRLDNVQVKDINELLLGRRALDGTLNASADIRGTLNDPIVAAEFSLTGGTMEGIAFNSLTGKANYQGRAVDLDARLEQSPAAVLTAVGTVPVPSGPGRNARTDEFDLTVKSTPIDIALFQAATTQVTKLSGQMQADVHVAGTLEAPRLNGLVETANAGFTVPATGVTYQNALARLMFEGDRLFVDRFEVSDDDQDRLVAIGDFGIVRRSVGQMNVQVSASQFKVLDNQFGHVEIDADLRVTGEVSKPQVTGELSTENGRVEVDQILEQLGRSPYSTAATVATTAETADAVPAESAAVATPSGLYNAATFDVRVRLPDDMVLRGRDMHASFSRIGLGDMNITVGGDLQIRKAPGGEPDVIGSVNVVRGYYDFQGRRFEVMRDSQIRFQGVRPIDPALQVNAQRLISGVTAIINIRGTARQPVVQLSSSPPLDEADVLSLIVFNQPINQLGEGERLNIAERAGGLAAGYLASPLANSIADALDLDIFEIRASGGINGQPSVAVGQQFGSRLFVSFRQEFGSAERSELSLEYRINELLRLVSTVSQGARQSHRTQRVDTTGVDLIYVLSY